MGLIFNPYYKSYEDERLELMENFVKLRGGGYIFEDFNSKLVSNPKPEILRKDLIVLTSLVEGVKDKDLKLEIYHQIVSGLVLLLCAGYEQ